MKNSRIESMNKLADRLENKYAGSEQYDIPMKCKLGFHEWGKPVRVEIRHESKPNEKKPWIHKCFAEKKFCAKCGKNSAIERACQPPITPLFGAQPSVKADLGVDPSAPTK